MAHGALIVFSEISADVRKPLEGFPRPMANNVACFIGVAVTFLSHLAEEIRNTGGQTSSLNVRIE